MEESESYGNCTEVDLSRGATYVLGKINWSLCHVWYLIITRKTLLLERFSFECCKTKTKTKTKVITLANHKEHRQYSEPIKTRSNYT